MSMFQFSEEVLKEVAELTAQQIGKGSKPAPSAAAQSSVPAIPSAGLMRLIQKINAARMRSGHEDKVIVQNYISPIIERMRLML